MASKREHVLSALFDVLSAADIGAVRRNTALPQSVPAGGLVILRDGDPGEPDVTLNPRREYYLHRAEIEVLVTEPISEDAFEVLDTLAGVIRAAVAASGMLGCLVENITWGGVEITPLAEDGAVPVYAARLPVTLEYLTSDALA